MTETQKPEDSLAEEFRNLGQNLVGALHTAWESPERKKLQQDLENCLTELASTLKRETETYSQSPTGQRLKSDVEHIRKSVESGEAETQLREGLSRALSLMNAELEKAAATWSANKPDVGDTEAPPPEEVQRAQ